MSYKIPPDHLPRPREEISQVLEGFDDRTLAAALQLEVLLDCRDFLAEIAVGMSELRTNTETIAIWAERQPK